MNFEEWFKTYINRSYLALTKAEQAVIKSDFEKCWQAAQKETDRKSGFGKAFNRGKKEGRKEFVEEALRKHNFYKSKVSTEKQLRDLVELLEKEVIRKYGRRNKART